MISVIVPVYNTAQYLRWCLDSILNQTLKDIEVICVDDGSTDASPQILDEYAAADNRIRVIHKENSGLVSARKIGLKTATGEYIGYVDSDDWIEPNMYEKLLAALIDEKAEIAMCGRIEETGHIGRESRHGFPAGRYDKQGLKEKIYPGMIVNDAFFEWGIFPGIWDKLFRRECLEQFQMEVDERLTMGEDAACTYPALLNVESIYISDECLYHYRQSASSMVKQTDGRETERKRYRILYQSVMKSLSLYKGIFDLTSQWEEYLLFLMTPRADILLDGMEKLDYLFPFPRVQRDSDIILYGMGIYGQRLYQFIKKSGFCNIVACVDRNYLELNRQGMNVVAPEEIDRYECDTIVIANSFAKTRAEILADLSKRYPAKKIYEIDEKLIKSSQTWESFGFSDVR